MSDIEKAIELLKTINQNMKAEHMAKDMCHGVTKEEIANYRKEFNLINVAIEALEKQIPKKPINIKCDESVISRCKCGRFQKQIYFDKAGTVHGYESAYCEYCGQAIDWSVEE